MSDFASGRLIDETGQPRLGLFKPPLEQINYHQFDLRDPFDRPRGRLARYFGLKQFQFLGLTGPDLVLGCALVDLRYVANAFIYLYEAANDRLEERSFLLPLGAGMSWPDTPNAGTSRFKKGHNHFSIALENQTRRLRVEIPGKSDKRIELDLRFQMPTSFEPLALCTRTGYSGWTYTQKACGLEVSGNLFWRGRQIHIDPLSLQGCSDWSCGYMRRETNWNWASLSGLSQEGRKVGFNLAAGVNETGFTENALWYQGRMFKLDTVHFSFSRLDPMKLWRLHSQDGKLELNFVPRGLRRERLNFGLLASNFRQIFGTFSGRLQCGSETLEIKEQMGFTEDHFARW